MVIRDWVAAAWCFIWGHRIQEQPDGQMLCVRCKRWVIYLP